ncbi:MAG: hypothetical protein E5V53_17690, partial [Mesorhizobium sp.]
MEHDLFQKPVPTFWDHGLLLAHDLFRKPVPTFWDHGLLLEHDLFQKPVPTFWDHALVPAALPHSILFLCGMNAVR